MKIKVLYVKEPVYANGIRATRFEESEKTHMTMHEHGVLIDARDISVIVPHANIVQVCVETKAQDARISQAASKTTR